MAGKYINKGNYDFVEARNAYYVDKSELIGFINRTLSTPAKMTCVSRARRFGKSLALQMLYAYYDCSCNSQSLFDDLKIAEDPTYRQHLNKYWVIHLDITTFITGASAKERIIDEMTERVIYNKKTKVHECSIESISVDEHQNGTKLALSWHQAGTKLALSQERLKLLLSKMAEPVSASTLRRTLGFTDATKFKNNYLQPLIDDGYVAMTRPDTPTSPKQEYYLTKKGRTLLESIN